MKTLNAACSLILCASTLASAQEFSGNNDATALLGVRATTVTELGFATIAAAGIRFLFAPHTVHEVWPDYGYRLDNLRKARVCTDEAFTAQAPNFALDYAALVHSSSDNTNYTGVTLPPIESREVSPSSENHTNERRLNLRDLCQWIQFDDAIAPILEQSTNVQFRSSPEPASTYIITNKVLPDTKLTFDTRFNLEADPDSSITWTYPDSVDTQELSPVDEEVMQ